jgi:predicted O-methyltransferase YrrM
MDQTPWLVPASIKHLERLIQPDWHGWEWGCGGSTVWFARHLQHLTSIEHDAEWVAQVRQRLLTWQLTNVELRHIEKGTGYYEQYADSILPVPDGSLQLVSVDGRARPRCIQNAIGKLAPGGVLVVDNMERDYYQEETDQIPDDWERFDYEGEWNGRWLTSLWMRA